MARDERESEADEADSDDHGLLYNAARYVVETGELIASLF